MAQHYEINPDQRGLALRVANRALRVANGLATARPGNVFIPNKGDDGMTDGTGTWIGSGDVGNGGVAPWIGDTTPPGKPTGVSAKCRWGILTASWGGTLEGGVPADFDHVSVALDGVEVGRLPKAGDVTVQGLEDGRTVTVSFTAYDAARDRLGNPAPNASETASIEVAVSDERAEIDADVAEAKREAEDAAQAAQAASEKADSFQEQIADVTVAVNGAVQDVAELSQEVSGAVSDASQALTTATQAKQTADAISDTAQRAYENADEALTQSSSAVQTADGIVETLESDYLSKDEAGGLYATQSELERTADEISMSVDQVRDESVILDGADGPVAAIGPNAGMAPFGVDVGGLTRQNLWVNPTGTSNGITVTSNDDGSVTVSGTATEAGQTTSGAVYTLKPGTTYAASGTGLFTVYELNESGSVIATHYTTQTFTTSAQMKYCVFAFYFTQGSSNNGTYRVMLNEGSEAEPWCPPGLSSINGLEVWTAGRNLFDIPDNTAHGITVSRGLDGSYVVSGTSTADTFKSSRSIVLPHGKVTVSLDKGMQSGTCFSMYQYDALDNVITYKDFQSAGTVEVDILDTCSHCMIGFYASNGVAVSGEYRIMMSLSGETEWSAPSDASSVDIPLLGNSLRSLPDGTRDSLSIDATGNVAMVKRVGMTDAGDGSSWAVNPNFAGGKHGFSLAKDDAAVYQDAVSASPMCNALSVHQADNGSMRDGSVKHTTGRSMIARRDACADIASWRTWLSSSGFRMLYALEEPQTIPLGHVDLPELPADGAAMWVVAEDPHGNAYTLEPESSFRWYGENAEALGEYATKAQLRVEADAIRAEVSETYVDKETGDATYAAKSEAEQLPGQILSQVSEEYQSKDGMSSYYTKTEVDQKSDNLELAVYQAVDGIEVGGRNLLLESDTPNRGYSATSYPAATYPISSVGIVSGQEYTWTVDGNFTGAETVAFYFTGGTYGTAWAQIPGDGHHTVTLTFTASSNMASNDARVDIYVRDSRNTPAFNGTAVINWAKLERGNKPTDWTPAPEDAEEKMASLEVDIEGISGTVSDLDGRVFTVEQTASGFEARLGEAEDDASSALSKANSAASAAAAANKVFYATSTTAAATKAKTATVSGSGFALVVGVTVSVRFQYANTADSPTLNVNSTGAKPIVSNGTATPTANLTWNAAWATVTFVYDGSQWRISGDNSIVKANSAQSTANTANTTANAAKTAAATAQTTANNAAKTATNYLKFDSSGLCVGSQTTTLGYNTLIKSNGVDMRNGSTVLSGFGASTVELGRNSKSAVIKMAGGVAQVKVSQENGRESATFGNVAGGSYAAFSEIEAFLRYGSSTLGVDEDLNRTNMCGWHYPVGSTVLTRYSIPIGDLVDSVSRSKALVPLWSGTLNLNGSVSISSLGKYRTIGIGVPLGASNSVVETYVTIHFLSGETTLMGIGGGATASDIRIAGVRLTRSGNTLKYTYGMIMSLNPSSGLNQTRNAMPIKSIVGIG